MFINGTFNWVICRQSLITPFIECYTIPVPNPTAPQCHPGRHFVYFNCTTLQYEKKKKKKKSRKQHKYMYRPTHNTKFLTKTHVRC